VYPSKIEVVKNWKAPRTLSELHSFLGLVGYYRRFIENFSKIAKSLTILTQKSLPDGPENFMVYRDAPRIGLGCVLMQRVRFYLMEMDCMLSTSNEAVQFDVLIQKLRQKEVDEESCVKTCSMNWGEANSVYTSYIVSSASNGKIQAGALIFVLVGYIKELNMNTTLQSSIKDRILAAQKEAVDESEGLQ
ncbi:hypothetical protein Tco_0403535, partial [Tanacetum coccineum]